MSWWYHKEYESVGAKRVKAAKLVTKLRAKNPDLKPVSIAGRAIATSFWGKAWCKHMDQMADYDNRLPRGRSYARNGAICHLEIRRGEVVAWVSGTTLYTITIRIKPLHDALWKRIQAACLGKIDTLLDVLRGKLSKEVMAVVCHPETGIFPQFSEIALNCSCPDGAVMCKHVAATLYGVGNRLDKEPSLLFLLRHVDPVELFSLDMPEPPQDGAASLHGVDLGGLFGIDITEDAVSPATAGSAKKSATAPPAGKSAAPSTKQAVRKKNAQPPSAPAPVSNLGAKQPRKSSVKKKPAEKTGAPGLPALSFAQLTGADIKAFREAAGLSVYIFAARVGVTQATVVRWEKAPGIVGLSMAAQKGLAALERKLRRKA